VRRSFVFFLCAAAQSPAIAADGALTLGVGLDYSSGEYGKTETTSVATVQFGAKYDTQRWTFRASLPFLRISGPAGVVGVGPDAIVLPGEFEGRRDESGVGDLGVSATYRAIADPAAPLLVDVGARVKLATADESKGLGTGKNDYSLYVDVARNAPGVSPFATLGYRWYGDPAGIELRNAWFGTVGFAWRDASGTSLGAAYDYRQRTVDGGANASELMVFLAQPLGAQWKAQLYFIRGFSDASPDAGVGAFAAYSF